MSKSNGRRLVVTIRSSFSKHSSLSQSCYPQFSNSSRSLHTRLSSFPQPRQRRRKLESVSTWRLTPTMTPAPRSKAEALDIEDLHATAVAAGENTYRDPETGFTVFTETFHNARGFCCGNKCRHCPYQWENVKAKKKKQATQQQQQYNILKSSTKKEKKKNVPYTRTGDNGTSALFTGERRPKTDAVFASLGTVDELCCVVGVAHAELYGREWATTHNGEQQDFLEQLVEIMSRLFDIGSLVAKPARKRMEDSTDESDTESASAIINEEEVPTFDSIHVQHLETWIDEMTESLPELTSFVLPTGTPAAAQLHVARTVARRAERSLWDLAQEQGSQSTTTVDCAQYLNRLSDFCFVAARWVNAQSSGILNVAEIQYRRPEHAKLGEQRVVTKTVVSTGDVAPSDADASDE